MDALDASEVMLEQAKLKDRYNRYYVGFVGKNKLQIKNGLYAFLHLL